MVTEESLRLETLDLIESDIYINHIESLSFDDISDLPFKRREDEIKMICGDKSIVKLRQNFYDN